jgi:hypothetical protein
MIRREKKLVLAICIVMIICTGVSVYKLPSLLKDGKCGIGLLSPSLPYGFEFNWFWKGDGRILQLLSDNSYPLVQAGYEFMSINKETKFVSEIQGYILDGDKFYLNIKTNDSQLFWLGFARDNDLGKNMKAYILNQEEIKLINIESYTDIRASTCFSY